MRWCIICSSSYQKEVSELHKQGKNFREIKEFLEAHDIPIFEASIRYHLLNHALAESEKPKETDDEKYWRWCGKFGKSKVDPYWLKSGRKIPEAIK